MDLRKNSGFMLTEVLMALGITVFVLTLVGQPIGKHIIRTRLIAPRFQLLAGLKSVFFDYYEQALSLKKIEKKFLDDTDVLVTVTPFELTRRSALFDVLGKKLQPAIIEIFDQESHVTLTTMVFIEHPDGEVV